MPKKYCLLIYKYPKKLFPEKTIIVTCRTFVHFSNEYLLSFKYAYIHIFSLPFCLRHTYQLLKKNKKKKENFTSFKCVCHTKGFWAYISRKVTHQDVFGNKKQTPPTNGRTRGLLLSHLRSQKDSAAPHYPQDVGPFCLSALSSCVSGVLPLKVATWRLLEGGKRVR